MVMNLPDNSTNQKLIETEAGETLLGEIFERPNYRAAHPPSGVS